jgi:muconolactone delta-isomerase
MKFLVIVTPRPAPMPPGVAADMLSAQRDWLQARLDDGTLECAYGLIGGGGIGIANADSHEEMHALVVGSPGFALADYDIRPLGDFATTIDAGIGAMRQAASMMPGPPG